MMHKTEGDFPKQLYITRIATLTSEIEQLNKHNRLVVIYSLVRQKLH